MVLKKLSLFEATIINVNIMLGSGIFINTVLLSKEAGLLGSAGYLCVALLILPLIFTMSALVNRYPEGGFYTYATETLNSFAGFMSGWIYFVAKLASASLMIHISVQLLQQLIPFLTTFSTFAIDTTIICLFVALNMFNMRIGTKIIQLFVAIKMTPILFVLLSGWYLINPKILITSQLMFKSIPTITPYVLYSFISFEMSCSLSHSIKGAKKNAPRALFLSYGLVLLLTVFFQLMLFLTIGPALTTKQSFLATYPTFLHTLFVHTPSLVERLTGICHIAIATSAIGGAYGMLFSNHWNLHTLAQKEHTFFRKILTYKNRHNIPIAGVIIEGILCIGYLFVSNGNQPALQQIGALGPTIAFTISSIGLLYAHYCGTKFRIPTWISWLALISCTVLLGAFVQSFMTFGYGIVMPFFGVTLFGMLMYALKKRPIHLSHLDSH